MYLIRACQCPDFNFYTGTSIFCLRRPISSTWRRANCSCQWTDSVIISLVGLTSGQQGWTNFYKIGPTMGRRSIPTWAIIQFRLFNIITWNISLLKIPHVFEIKKFLCVPKTQITFIRSCVYRYTEKICRLICHRLCVILVDRLESRLNIKNLLIEEYDR